MTARVRTIVWFACLACLADARPARSQCGIDGASPCNPWGFGYTDCCRPVDYVSSLDPNDLVGPAGIGVSRALARHAYLPYTVYFENVATATAPAQEVRVIDTLDPARFDLSTFAFLTVGFGDTVVAAPPGAASFSRDIDLRPGRAVIVRFEGSLDAQSGVLTCRFRSLDPATLDPLDDPDGGFLPPNQHPPEGEGLVSYILRAPAPLPTGTELPNTARVVFDQNPAIDTPEWRNTIDADAPASQVDPLPDFNGRTRFGVSWGGTDVGSGVRDYDVYVSDDGGPYELWLEHTPAAADTFPGLDLHTYRFYSVARDSVGNVEPPPGQPDATTRVDVSTAALPGLVEAQSDTRHVRLLWFVSGPSAGATVERRTSASAWQAIGEPFRSGTDYLEFRDTTVVAGQRYGYRLGLTRSGVVQYFGEVWVATDARVELALGAPNPARNPVVLDFALPGHEGGLLELFDISGRRMFARQLFGAGAHRYSLSEAGDIPAGAYVLRLGYAGRALTRKLVVLR